MTRVLWVSRHYMTEAQENRLREIFGEVEIISCDKTVDSVSSLASEYDDIDVYAVVFPTHMLAELYEAVKGKSRIITPISERCETGGFIINPATGKKEKEYSFKLKYWLEYTKIEVETRILWTDFH